MFMQVTCYRVALLLVLLLLYGRELLLLLFPTLAIISTTIITKAVKNSWIVSSSLLVKLFCRLTSVHNRLVYMNKPLSPYILRCSKILYTNLVCIQPKGFGSERCWQGNSITYWNVSKLAFNFCTRYKRLLLISAAIRHNKTKQYYLSFIKQHHVQLQKAGKLSLPRPTT